MLFSIALSAGGASLCSLPAALAEEVGAAPENAGVPGGIQEEIETHPLTESTTESGEELPSSGSEDSSAEQGAASPDESLAEDPNASGGEQEATQEEATQEEAAQEEAAQEEVTQEAATEEELTGDSQGETAEGAPGSVGVPEEELPSLVKPENDLNSAGPPFCRAMSVPPLPQSIQNPDGSYTYTQVVNASSGPPYYERTSSGGFGIYSGWNQDYGWMHDFPDWNTPGLAIQSATMTIRAWDVDSEVWHGLNGEYDGVSVDGTMLNPGYLQGGDDQWSETVFDVPVESIVDDGKMNIWLDIDMYTKGWLTTLESSTLVVNYRLDGVVNNPPSRPDLAPLPSGIADDEDLVVSIIGPYPADVDNDTVTYQYRWFVNVGNGFFVDDEFAGRNDHTGNTVPASDTQLGDVWRVQVKPVDGRGAVGPFVVVTWDLVRSVVAYDDTVTVDQDSPRTITLRARDINGNSLIYEIEGAPEHGVLSEISGNTVTYTPNPGYAGPDIITFKAFYESSPAEAALSRASSGQTMMESNVATININVSQKATPPPVSPGPSPSESVERYVPRAPEGPLVNRMPGFINIGKPVEIDEVQNEMIMEYDKALLGSGDSHNVRVFYWNERAKKWVALATCSAGEGKVKGINDNGYKGWFTVFGVIEPLFSDISGHWAEQLTDRMNGLGVIEGYPTEKGILVREARLDKPVTRTEFAVFLVRLLNIDADRQLVIPALDFEVDKILSSKFEDAGQIPRWAAGFLAAAVQAGILEGRDGKLEGDMPITRAEAAVMASKALKRYPGFNKEDVTKYIDMDEIPDWARAVLADGVMSGYPDGTLRPNDFIKRCEALSVFRNIFVYGIGW
ncbi:MAG: S-layer homology domain-containing protein [Bacillota bacterium]